VSDRIPESYLFKVRKKYLDFDTRAQRKDYLLKCKDPRSRYLFAILFCDTHRMPTWLVGN